MRCVAYRATYLWRILKFWQKRDRDSEGWFQTQTVQLWIFKFQFIILDLQYLLFFHHSFTYTAISLILILTRGADILRQVFMTECHENLVCSVPVSMLYPDICPTGLSLRTCPEPPWHPHPPAGHTQAITTNKFLSLINDNKIKSREAVSVPFRSVSLPAQCEDFPRSVSPGSHSFEWVNDGPVRLKPTAQCQIDNIARVPWMNLNQSVTECVVVLTESTLPWFLRCSLYFWSTYSSYLPKIGVMTYRAGKNYR